MNTSEVAAQHQDGHPSFPTTTTAIVTHTYDKPAVVVVTKHVVLENRVVKTKCGVCRGDSLSLYYKCDLCAEQLAGNTYVKRMRLLAEAAERFHERELGKPYVEFRGVARVKRHLAVAA